MTTEVFANLASTTVAASKGAVAGGTIETWTVASSASFPAVTTAAGTQFRIVEDDATNQSEVMLVTNITGTTWTVTRGAEGTTPVAHSAGFTIRQIVTRDVLASFSQLDVANNFTQSQTITQLSPTLSLVSTLASGTGIIGVAGATNSIISGTSAGDLVAMPATSANKLLTTGNFQAGGTISEGAARVYSPNNKPLASDIGAGTFPGAGYAFGNAVAVSFAMTSGAAGYIGSSGTSLFLKGGTSGVGIRNNADSASVLTVSDAGNLSVAGTSALTGTTTVGATGAGTTNGDLILAAQASAAGNGSSLTWTSNTTASWRLYKLPGDSNLYLRDLVNAKMHATFAPGAPGTTTFADDVIAGGNLYGRTAVYAQSATAATGYSSLAPGNGSISGYLAFYGPNGTRTGYIGAGTNAGSADAGTVPYVANTHAFTGAITTTSTITENGNRVYSSANPNLASSAPPQVSSASAVGTGTTYARDNHTHGGVISVAGRQGSVTLTAPDVGAGTFAGANYTIGAGTTTAGMTLNGSASTAKYFAYQSAGAARWQQEVSGTESGSNAGGDMLFKATADNGVTSLGTALTLTRSTLAASFGGALNTVGNISENGSRVYSPNNKPTAGDIGSGTFPGAAYIASGTWTFTGGIAMTGVTPGFEIGAVGTSNTPYFDFHSSASSTDYDVRLLATGGTASTGAGTLTLLGATFVNNAALVVQDNNVTVQSSTAGWGKSLLTPGTSSLSGQVAFYTPNGNRAGYIGNVGGTPSADSGTINYVAGAHAFTGTATTTGDLTVGSGSAASNVNVNGAASTARKVVFQTGGVARWKLGPNAVAESGSNAGSDFLIQANDDAGTNLGTYLTITRATGAISTLAAVTTGGDVTVSKNIASLILTDTLPRTSTVGQASSIGDIAAGSAAGDLVLKAHSNNIYTPGSLGVLGAIATSSTLTASGDITANGSSLILKDDATPIASASGQVGIYSSGGRGKLVDAVGNVWNLDSSSLQILSADVTSTSTTAATATGFSYVLGAGTYVYECNGSWRSSAATGIRFTHSFTGTSTAYSLVGIVGYSGGTGAAGLSSNTISTVLGTAGGGVAAAATNTDYPFQITGRIVVTVAGTFAMTFGASSASTITMRAGTYMRLTRVA